MGDPFGLEPFVEAQGPVIERVLGELGRGRKASHWMWFVFPQLAGLGHSAMARRYAIGSRAEAEAYLGHAVLGPRLVACTGLVNGVVGRSATEILGVPDDVKFRSCVTLFAAVASGVPGGGVFQGALERFFGGVGDEATVRLLAGAG